MRNGKGQFVKGSIGYWRGKTRVGKISRCLICDKNFRPRRRVGRDTGEQKFCSMICYRISRKGVRVSMETEFKKDSIPWNWKNGKAGYVALHNWIRRRYGSPMQCENCKKVKETKKQIHWANLSGKYLWDRKDWKRLCVSCHKNFDLGNIIL